MELVIGLALLFLLLMVMWEVGAWLVAILMVLVVVQVLPWWVLALGAVVWVIHLLSETQD